MEATFWESLKQFFSPKEKVHNHWYAPVDNFHFASADFYKRIEAELEARKVPGLEISRVKFKEGGLLSANREYLRLKRERLVFDICAAPFGTGFFFSFRFVELPLGVKPLEILVLFGGLAFLFYAVTNVFGLIWGLIILLTLIAVSIFVMRNAAAMGLADLDTTLLEAPVIGPLYEILFRKETYYREDTRLMYLSTVDFITKTLVDDVTAAKGIKKVKRYERQPILGNLYHETTTSGKDDPSAKAA
jgi:hypothetical protein